MSFGNFCLPYRNSYFLQMIGIIDNNHDLLIPPESSVSQKIRLRFQHLDRTLSESQRLSVDLDHLTVEIDQIPFFSSPRISSPVIRIRETTKSCFVSIIKGRCSRPGHLHDDRFPHNCKAYPFFCRTRPKLSHTANLVVGTRQETGMVMV